MIEELNVSVVGAGLMGCGIAQVFATRGIRVRLHDPLVQARAQARAKIQDNLERVGLDKAIADNVYIEEDLEQAVREADLVIEAAPEKIDIKRAIFSSLLKLVRDDCLLASNTSVIPISDIADGLNFSGRIVGTHWWNPPYLVPLVEVVKSNQTSLETINYMMALLQDVGKTPAYIEKDVPGFVGNRLQHALWREAIALVNDGVCSAETLDSVVKNSFGMRLPVLGPLENADLVGLDLTLDIHNVILRSLNRDVSPSSVLQQKVNNNALGMKSHQGLRSWTDESISAVHQRLAEHLSAMTKRQEIEQ
jgi:3-hydroxybutyryl-CoA dehydrogenase